MPACWCTSRYGRPRPFGPSVPRAGSHVPTRPSPTPVGAMGRCKSPLAGSGEQPCDSSRYRWVSISAGSPRLGERETCWKGWRSPPAAGGGGLKVARKADTRSINSCGVARMGSPRIQPALPSVASVARLKGALGKRPTPSSRRRVLLVIRWLAPPKPRDPLPPTTPQAIGTDTGPTVDSQGAVAVTKRSSSLEISGRSDRWDHHEQICPSGLATHCNLARSSHRPFSGINLSRSPLLRYSVRYRPR